MRDIFLDATSWPLGALICDLPRGNNSLPCRLSGRLSPPNAALKAGSTGHYYANAMQRLAAPSQALIRMELTCCHHGCFPRHWDKQQQRKKKRIDPESGASKVAKNYDVPQSQDDQLKVKQHRDLVSRRWLFPNMQSFIFNSSGRGCERVREGWKLIIALQSDCIEARLYFVGS